MSNLKYPNRVVAEIYLVSSHFGGMDFPTEHGERTVLIENFNLPPGYNKTSSKLLIELSHKYPETPVEAMYIEKGLEKNGRQPGHYFENKYGDVSIRQSGYAWYSIHFNSWNANIRSMIRGDNLLTAVNALYHALKTDD